MEEIIITKSNFDRVVLQSKKPIIVDFFADWCYPCRLLSSVINELSTNADNTFLIGKVNVDTQKEIAQKYNVTAIPTVIRFDNGVATKRISGFYPLEDFCALLELKIPKSIIKEK